MVFDEKLCTRNLCRATEDKGKFDRALRLVLTEYRPRTILRVICWMAYRCFLKLNKKLILTV